MKLGSAAGAGILGHLYRHIVSRCKSDANLMPVVGDVKVLPQLLRGTREKIMDA